VADASLSRTELMRRERMREELRNEDLLQERLEDLRLQDEKRRTGQLAGAVTPAPTVAPATALMPSSMTVAPVSPVVEQQVVSVPVSDSSAVGAVSTVKLADSSGGLSAASPDEALTMRLSPRGGLASFVGSNAYALEGRYTVGLGIDLGISEHLGFELGYAYSDFGLALNDATAQALAWYMNPYGFSYGGADNPTGALRQNVIDGGIKLHLLGTASRIRPFIGGGAGYSKSFLNYDSRILNFLRQYGYGVPPDYELSQFLAYASAGVEVQVSKKVSIGANFRHYSVLSSRQNQNLNNLALYGPYPGALNTGFSGAPSPTQQFVGGSLANTSFQSVTATVSFAF
jgi:opacity protein-like surface antigen